LKSKIQYICHLQVKRSTVSACRDANLNTVKGSFFGRDAIEEILAQNGCVGIRAYQALKDPSTMSPKLTLVLCGVDADQNDMLGQSIIMEYAVLCPPSCGNANALNSDPA
jgi:hypothetical protein